MLGINLTKVSPNNPDPEIRDNVSERFIIEIANSNKINFKVIKLVFIPSNNFAPISNIKKGIKYAAKPKKTNTRLATLAK